MVVAVSLGFFRNAAPGDMMNLCAGVEGTPPPPPTRAHKLMGTRPLVHVGFMKSWLAGGFNLKVLNRVMQLISARQDASRMDSWVARMVGGWVRE